MADFKEGVQYQKGDIVSEQARTGVGIIPNKNFGTITYHRTVTKITSQDQNGKVSGAQTEIWVIADKKDGKGEQWIKASTTTDGGKTHTFNNETRADGSKLVGDSLRRDISSSTSDFRKNTDRQTNLSLDKAGISKQDKPTIVSSLTNKETASGTPSDEQSKSKTTDEQWKDAVGKSVGRNEFPGKGGKNSLRYPLTLDTSPQDKIRFDMLEYIPSTFNQSQFGFDTSARAGQRNVIGRVFLPIPAGISETTAATWGDNTMTAKDIALSQIGLGGITAGGEGFTKALEKVVRTTQNNSGDVKTALAAAITSDAVGSGAGLLTRITGAVLNPNLELLFGGPTLRPFSFTFKMSARSEEEAKQIIGIIRFFKQGMAPQKSESNLFVKSPHTFKITYLHQNKEHKFLNKFKECALQNFTVNYTPEGQYATFYDGPMVSYEITMQFQELEPIFNSDYGEGTKSSGPDTEIGF